MLVLGLQWLDDLAYGFIVFVLSVMGLVMLITSAVYFVMAVLSLMSALREEIALFLKQTCSNRHFTLNKKSNENREKIDA